MSCIAGRRPFETFETPPLQFLGEQVGPVETRLKDALTALLRNHRNVAAAFLARALHDGHRPGIVLALATDGEEDDQLVEQTGRIFASMFDASAHLDVIFLSDEQETDIGTVCPAFYRRARRWWPWS